MEDIFILVLYVLAMVALLWLYFVVPWNMAKNRNRNPWIWVGISIVGSPLLAILLLYALGDAPNTV
ncbi:hypothetical protein [Ruegeria arenilitoris]|uniref:hypothetical protein n=1 Tax=Ruegeria arenilitoris TaxID=1173585 RepID=UPI00147D2962|nr:hypothetical protein [Ruegeria arenilitoris]